MRENAASKVRTALREAVVASQIPLDAWAIRFVVPSAVQLEALLEGTGLDDPEQALLAHRLVLAGGRVGPERQAAIAAFIESRPHYINPHYSDASGPLAKELYEIRRPTGLTNKEFAQAIGDRLWLNAVREGVDPAVASLEANTIISHNANKRAGLWRRVFLMGEALALQVLDSRQDALSNEQYLAYREEMRAEIAEKIHVGGKRAIAAPQEATKMLLLLRELREYAGYSAPDISRDLKLPASWLGAREQKETVPGFDHVHKMRRILELPRILCLSSSVREGVRKSFDEYETALLKAEFDSALGLIRDNVNEGKYHGEFHALPVGVSFRDPILVRRAVNKRVPERLRPDVAELAGAEDERLLARARSRVYELRTAWFVENEVTPPETSAELVDLGIELAVLLGKAQKIAALDNVSLRKRAKIDKEKAARFFAGLTGDFPELLEVAVAFRQVCAPERKLDELIGEELARAYRLTGMNPVNAIPLHVSPYARPLGAWLRDARKAAGFQTLEQASPHTGMTKGQLLNRESGDSLDTYAAMLVVWRLLETYEPTGELYERLEQALADQTDWLHTQRYKELVHLAETKGYTADDQTRVLAVLTRAIRQGLGIGRKAMTEGPLSYEILKRIEEARENYILADFQFLHQLHSWFAQSAGARYVTVTALLTRQGASSTTPPAGQRSTGPAGALTSPNPAPENSSPEYLLYEADVQHFRELRQSLGISANPREGVSLITSIRRLTGKQDPAFSEPPEMSPEVVELAMGANHGSTTDLLPAAERESASEDLPAERERGSEAEELPAALERHISLPRLIAWPELPSVDPKLLWSQVARLFRMRCGLSIEVELTAAELAQVSTLDDLSSAELCLLANGQGEQVSEKTVRAMLTRLTPSSATSGVRNSWQTGSLKPKDPASVYAFLLRGHALSQKKHQAQGAFFFQQLRPNFPAEQQKSTLRSWLRVVHGESGDEELEAFRLVLTNVLAPVAPPTTPAEPREPVRPTVALALETPESEPEEADISKAEPSLSRELEPETVMPPTQEAGSESASESDLDAGATEAPEFTSRGQESESGLGRDGAELFVPEPQQEPVKEGSTESATRTETLPAREESPELSIVEQRQLAFDLIVARMRQEARALAANGLGYTIAELIAEGELAPKMWLPTGATLDAELQGRNSGLANLSYSFLRDSGLLVVQTGKGSFVAVGDHADAVPRFLATLPARYPRDPRHYPQRTRAVPPPIAASVRDDSGRDGAGLWQQISQLAVAFFGQEEQAARDFDVPTVQLDQACDPELVETLLDRVNALAELSPTRQVWPKPTARARTPEQIYGALLRGYACRHRLTPKELYGELSRKLSPSDRNEQAITRLLKGLVSGENHSTFREFLTKFLTANPRQGGISPLQVPFPMGSERAKTYFTMLAGRGTHYDGWVDSDWPVLAAELLAHQPDTEHMAFSQRLRSGHGYDTYGDLRQVARLLNQQVPADAELLPRLWTALRRHERWLDERTRLELGRGAVHFPGWRESSWPDVGVLCRKIRAKHQLDAHEVAAELECLPAHVHRWEAGGGYRNTTPRSDYPYPSDVELTQRFLARWPASTPDWPADEAEVRTVREFLNTAAADLPYQTYREWLWEQTQLPEAWEDMVVAVYSRRADAYMDRPAAEIAWKCRSSALKALEEGKLPETDRRLPGAGRQISDARAVVVGAGLEELWEPALASIGGENVPTPKMDLLSGKAELCREFVGRAHQILAEALAEEQAQASTTVEDEPADSEPESRWKVAGNRYLAAKRREREEQLKDFAEIISGEAEPSYGTVEAVEKLTKDLPKADRQRIHYLASALRKHIQQDFERKIAGDPEFKKALLTINRSFGFDPERADMTIEAYFRPREAKKVIAQRKLGVPFGMGEELLDLLGNCYGWGQEVTRFFPSFSRRVPGVPHNKASRLDGDAFADIPERDSAEVDSVHLADFEGADYSRVSDVAPVAFEYEEDGPGSVPCATTGRGLMVTARWQPGVTPSLPQPGGRSLRR